jgi:hypothetical protein
MKKPKAHTPTRSVRSAEPSPKPVAAKRVFGSAKGQIIFKKGWNAPMTKRELDEFIGAGDLGPELRKLKTLMRKFHHHE